MVRIAVLLCSIMLLYGQTMAQPFPEATPFRFITTPPDLQDRRLGAMVEDARGRVWIGSWEGLFVTNGSSVDHLRSDPQDSSGICGRRINWLALQGDSLIWLATENGICAWHIERGTRWRPQWLGKIPAQRVVHLCMIDDRLWVCWKDVLASLDTRTGDLRTYGIAQIAGLSGELISAAPYPGRNDRVIITTTDQVAEFFPGPERAVIYLERSGKGKYRTSPAHVQNGWIWIGSWGQGMRRFRLDHSGSEHLPITQMNGVLGGYTTSVWRKDDSTLWVPSEYGVLEVDANSAAILRSRQVVHPFYDIQEVLTSMALNLRDGTVLVSTDNGLAKLSASIHASHLMEFPDDGHTGLTPLWVMAMHQACDNDDILIGTYDGLGVLRESAGNWRVIDAPRSSEDGRAVRVNGILCARDGTTWLASRDGPMFMKPSDPSFRALHPSECFWSAGLYEGRDGRIWVGTGKQGVLIWDPIRETEQWLTHDAQDPRSLISNNTIRAFQEDTLGRMWIGTKEGLSVCDMNGEACFNFGQDPAELNGFVEPFVYSIVRDSKGGMWLSLANGGIRHVEVTPEGRMNMKAYDQRIGMDPDRTIHLRIDGQDRLWAVDKGVLMLDTRTGSFRHFGKEDGIIDLPDGDAPLLVTRDGRLILGISGEAQLQVFQIDELIRPSDPVPIEFIEIGTRAGNALAGRDAMRPLDLRLGSADLPLYAEFAAIDMTRPQAHQYEYWLDGLDTGWRSLGNVQIVRFASLDPGVYILHVRSTLGGEVLRNDRSVRFTIVAPWYRTSWAKIIGGLLLMGIALLLLRKRVRSVRRSEQEKAAFQKKLAEVEMQALRAQMNPHFLFNSLNSIKYYALTKSPRETADYLGKFAMLIRRILQNSREDLVPLKDELEALRLYIEIESMRLENKFDHVLELDPQLNEEDIRIPPMLIQPYVENAIWHGLMNKEERGALSVRVNEDQGELQIIIEDDGVGRAKAEEIKNAQGHRERSFGMRITAERMELSARTLGLGLRSSIEDLIDELGSPNGTRVILHVPIVNSVIT